MARPFVARSFPFLREAAEHEKLSSFLLRDLRHSCFPAVHRFIYFIAESRLAAIFLASLSFVIFHMRGKKRFLCFIAQLLNFLSSRSSYYASTLFPAVNPQPRAVKRQRLMASPQQRSAGILANSQNQVVIQSPQAQQQIAANKLTTAANNLLQLQQQQQIHQQQQQQQRLQNVQRRQHRERKSTELSCRTVQSLQ
jgi:hypothetical protein